MGRLSAIGIAAGAGIMLGIAAAPANAQVVRPWCEYGAMFGRVPDCSFATFAQCMATAWGDGTCVRNPAFDWPYYQRGQIPPADTDYRGRPLPKPRR
jgi:Protein of unknown function (DUF3551)